MQRRTEEGRLASEPLPDRRLPADADAPRVADTRAPSSASALVRSLRLHQCAKNLIVFVPLILGGRLTDLDEVFNTVVAFVALTWIASGTYLVNDVRDIAEDRKHWSKRFRPIAAGHLSTT